MRKGIEGFVQGELVCTMLSLPVSNEVERILHRYAPSGRSCKSPGSNSTKLFR